MSSKLISSILYSVGITLILFVVYSDYQTLSNTNQANSRQYDLPPKYTNSQYTKPTANLFVSNREWRQSGQREDLQNNNITEPVEQKNAGEWFLRAIVLQQGRYMAWIERPGLTPLHQGYGEGDKLPNDMQIKTIDKNSITVTETGSDEPTLTRLFPIK
ncbi:MULTISPECIES: hypothetical protein [unclassified Motilimonas]|uniref:hypothetical protein n=1 Tax=unclassified Motilimonas TaxID=2643697 RepID=UPI001E47CAE5|nr:MULTISPECIES: hypothetical protein [unclassified Motilimonas]MCE0558529.1 hypothetical protein [Motilimonas sp. E26]MDO6527416.1 hypothetical protein [Motilimonas sp. 1_MG-2023]